MWDITPYEECLSVPTLNLWDCVSSTLPKLGVDAGEMLGAASTGVVGTDDVDEILALDADVVLFNALGTTLVDLQGPVDEVSRFSPRART